MRITAKVLSKMSDEEYKLLTPEQLAGVNAELPEPNYENPYNPSEHPYPKMKYRLQTQPDGTRSLQKATVRNEREEKQLGKDWHANPTQAGVETAPGADPIMVEDFLVNFPAAEAPAEKSDAAAGA